MLPPNSFAIAPIFFHFFLLLSSFFIIVIIIIFVYSALAYSCAPVHNPVTPSAL